MSSFRSGSRSHRDRLLRELRTRMLCKYGLPECIPIIYKEIDTISGKPNISVEVIRACMYVYIYIYIYIYIGIDSNRG